MRKALTVTGVTFLVLLIACAVMVRFAGRSPIQRNVTVELGALPANTPPLRIVLLSDLHVARYGDSRTRLRETVERVSALHPDLILLAGDFLADPILRPKGIRGNLEPLAGLKARLGTIAVLGNHDYRQQGFVQLWLRRAGIRVLDNEAVRAGPLAVIGISDAFSGHARPRLAVNAGIRAGGVPIVVTHSPDIIPNLPPDIHLLLAGHTHCGQVVLPFLGPLDTHSRFGRRYACGIVREGRRIILVSGGLGVSRLPFRLGAPPDFWVIDVVPRKVK